MLQIQKLTHIYYSRFFFIYFWKNTEGYFRHLWPNVVEIIKIKHADDAE